MGRQILLNIKMSFPMFPLAANLIMGQTDAVFGKICLTMQFETSFSNKNHAIMGYIGSKIERGSPQKESPIAIETKQCDTAPFRCIA